MSPQPATCGECRVLFSAERMPATGGSISLGFGKGHKNIFESYYVVEPCVKHVQAEALLTKLRVIAGTPREGEVMEGYVDQRHERSSAAAYATLDLLIMQAREGIAAAQPKPAAQEGEAG